MCRIATKIFAVIMLLEDVWLVNWLVSSLIVCKIASRLMISTSSAYVSDVSDVLLTACDSK